MLFNPELETPKGLQIIYYVADISGGIATHGSGVCTNLFTVCRVDERYLFNIFSLTGRHTNPWNIYPSVHTAIHKSTDFY